jgi:hypothetical protein
VIANLISATISNYDDKFLWAFYRIFPLIAAIYIYHEKFPLHYLNLILLCTVVANITIGSWEFFFNEDLFQTEQSLHVVALDGDVYTRANGLFWVSLVYSSFLCLSALFFQKHINNRIFRYAIITACVLGVAASLNRMNFFLIILLCLVLPLLKINRLKSIVFLPIVFFIIFIIIDSFDYASSAFNISDLSNAMRINYWMLGLEHFYADILSFLVGGQVGIYGYYENGFESQYIQYAAEYGLLGIFFIILILVASWRNVELFLYLMVAFFTLRILDSYSTAFLTYLSILYFNQMPLYNFSDVRLNGRRFS